MRETDSGEGPLRRRARQTMKNCLECSSGIMSVHYASLSRNI